MRYLIDGYNVTMADSRLRPLSREGQREGLAGRVSTRGDELLGPGPKTIVFDGRPGGGPDEWIAGVPVRYARQGSADDLIVRMAEEAEGPLTVVSSDRGLRDRVRARAEAPVDFLGASALFVEGSRDGGGAPGSTVRGGPGREGAKGDGRRPRRRGRGMGGSTVGIPKGANRITEELKKVWLDEGEE